MAEPCASRARMLSMLETAWRLDPHEGEEVRKVVQDQGWTLTEVVKTFLNARIEHLSDLANKETTPSLADLTINNVIHTLSMSDDVNQQIRVIANSLEWPLFQRLIFSGRVPLPYLRKLFEFCPHKEINHVDFDFALLHHTVHVKSQIASQKLNTNHWKKPDSGRPVGASGVSLLSVNDVVDFLRGERVVRKNPPKGAGFETFDKLLRNEVVLETNPAEIKETFHLLTKNLFREMPWDSMVVVGIVPLQVALTFQQSVSVLYAKGHSALHKRQSLPPSENDSGPVEVRLYGREDGMRTPDLAAVKAEVMCDMMQAMWQIYHGTNGFRVTKTVESTRVQTVECIVDIKHHIYSTLNEAIADVPLDAGALAFDGEKLHLSGRCARAIETGYSTFNMNLPSHLEYTQQFNTNDLMTMRSIMIYAQNGYGLRFLPDYVQSLDDRPGMESQYSGADVIYTSWIDARTPKFKESGLQTMCRLRFLAADWIHRTLYAMNKSNDVDDMVPDESSSDDADEEIDDGSDVASNRGSSPGVRDNLPYKPDRELDYEAWLKSSGPRRMHRRVLAYPMIDEHPLVYWFEDENLPIASALANLESLFRCEELFNLNLLDESIDLFADTRDQSHRLFSFWLTPAIVARVCPNNVGFAQAEYSNYLTRRIRVEPSASSYEDLAAQQVVIPLTIPKALEAYVSFLLEQHCHTNYGRSLSMLHPIHRPHGGYTGQIPSLEDNNEEKGNLRYFITGPRTIWRGFSPQRDCVFNILWVLATWYIRHVNNWSIGIVRRQAHLDEDYFATSSGLILDAVRYFRACAYESDVLNGWSMGSQWLKGDEMKYFAAWVTSPLPGSPMSFPAMDVHLNVEDIPKFEEPFAFEQERFNKPGEDLMDKENPYLWT